MEAGTVAGRSTAVRVRPRVHESYNNFMEARKEHFCFISFSLYSFYKINAQIIFCFRRVMVNGFQPSIISRSHQLLLVAFF